MRRKKRIIYYEYNGRVVTRVDNGSESNYYFGKHEDKNNLPTSSIKSNFRGLNSGIDACLRFTPNGIEIYHSMGDFTTVGSIDSIKIIDNPKPNMFNYYFDDTTTGAYSNVCRISDALKLEQELNAKIFSKVKITYPDGADMKR